MVSKQFYQDIDMVNIGQLIGARHQNVNNADMTAMVTLLGSNNKGLVVWNTDQNKEFVWNGTSFIPHETIQNASTTQAGVVQLNDNINSTSTTQAATANAVKKAYDIGNNKLPLTGGTISGQLVAPNILINHSGTAASGISWYSSSYNSWQDYMAQAGSTGNGVYGNITAPTGTYVTTWARRSVIEPGAGYGWTFETMTMNGTAPSIVAELSINGTFKTAGDIHGANLTVS